MPVQINEVVIRAIVDPRPAPPDDDGEQQSSATAPGSGEEETVEKVLEILKEKRER